MVTAVSFWPSPAPAQEAAAETVKHPIGQRCVVTLDLQINLPLLPKGLSSDGTIEGFLVSVNADWVVLKDGNYENWIPRDKVLLMRASR